MKIENLKHPLSIVANSGHFFKNREFVTIFFSNYFFLEMVKIQHQKKSLPQLLGQLNHFANQMF
jgi:hypothetical protein